MFIVKRVLLLVMLVLPILGVGAPARAQGCDICSAATKEITMDFKEGKAKSLVNCLPEIPKAGSTDKEVTETKTEKDTTEGKTTVVTSKPQNEPDANKYPENAYICTEYLETTPYMALNTGDFCIFLATQIVKSGTTSEGVKMNTARYIIKKGAGEKYNTRVEFDTTTGSAPPENQRPTYGQIQCQAIATQSGLQAIQGYIGIIYRWATMLIGAVCVLMIIIGGLRMILAGPDSGSYEEGQTMIKNAIFGLVILFLAGVILNTVNPIFFTQ